MARSVDLGKGSRFIVLASVCIVVAGLYFAREVCIPLALAVLFTFVLAPLVNRLERLRVPRAPSVLLVVILAVGLVGYLSYTLVTQFFQVANKLPDYSDEIRAKLKPFHGAGKVTQTLQKIESAVAPTTTGPSTRPTSAPATAPAEGQESPPAVAARAVTEILPVVPPPPTQAPGSRPGEPALPHVTPDNPLPVRLFPETKPWKTVLEYLGSAVHPLATAFLVVVFVIFMLLNREDLRDRMIRLVGAGRLNMTTTALSDAATRISQYLLSLALVNLCYGAAVAGGLWLIGMLLGSPGHRFPNPLLWGMICGVARFIPYVGVWVGAAMPLALSFVLPGYGAFFATIAMFIVYEAIVSQFVEPMLYGARTGMSTIAVLASAVFWAWLWGPVGLLLSTPLTVVLVVIGKYVPQLQFLDIMLGDEPVLEPPVRLYQRMLALDAEEAAEVARAYLREHSLKAVFEDVMLPALALSEQDRHRGRLDEEREAFLRHSMRDLIEELSDLDRQRRDEKAAEQAVQAAAAAQRAATSPAGAALPAGAVARAGNAGGNGMPDGPPPVRADVPKGCTVNVVCLPAHDESDEIAGLMLAQLLEIRGYCTYALSQSALASEMVEAVEKHHAHLVVVSALPPAAVAHSRYLCKRLHGRFPEVNMVVGLWTGKGDLSKAKDRITCVGSVQLAADFTQALEQIQQLVQPVLVTAAAGARGAADVGARA